MLKKQLSFLLLLMMPFCALAEEFWNYQNERAVKTRTAYNHTSESLYAEAELINFDEDHIRNKKGLEFFRSNIITKVSKNSEVQMEVDTFNEREEGKYYVNSHFRYRYNLLQSNKMTAGIMPQLRVPTGIDFTNQNIKPGLSFPIDFFASSSWSMGGRFLLERSFNEEMFHWQSNFITSFYLGYNLLDNLAASLDLYDERSNNPYQDRWTNLDLILRLQASQHLQLNVGTSLGLNPYESSIEHFAGATVVF